MAKICNQEHLHEHWSSEEEAAEAEQEQYRARDQHRPLTTLGRAAHYKCPTLLLCASQQGLEMVPVNFQSF